MKKIGIFEAKTQFSSLCDEVARTGVEVVVERRGEPLVLVSPIPAALTGSRRDILTELKEYEKEHAGSEESDFPEVWKMRSSRHRSPLEE